MYFHYVMITCSSYESMSMTPYIDSPKAPPAKRQGKRSDGKPRLRFKGRRIAGKLSKFQVRFNEHRLPNVWLSETLLMSSVDPGVERFVFIARAAVDTATSSAILTSPDFSRPRILHALAFQCTGSFGEGTTRSTP